jgi:hypothetical protein
MKLLMFLIDLPIRFIFALVGFTLRGWIGWLGIILLSLRFLGIIHWPWWLAALPLEYGVIYCLYMTIDGALYRAGLKKIGDYARFTSFESREAEEVAKLSQIGTDAYLAEKQAELAPKFDAIVAEARERQKNKKETRQNHTVRLGDYCRFKPSMTSVTMWRMWEDGLIDLAAGDIVKVVTTPEHGMCHVNKPGNCPVIATMELVNTEWLEPVKGEFKECEYCAAIDHETSNCPYRGKVPYGWKGTGPWRIEGGKMLFD